MNRVRGMDPGSSAINTAANAADACRQIWQLCELWHDAPKEISQLRDELAQANEFFSMVQLAVTKHNWVRTMDWVGQLTYELEECFHKAETVVREVQANLTTFLDVSSTYGLEISNKRRRALWLRRHDEVGRLRKHLKEAMFEICSILALLDNPGSLEIQSFPSDMKKLIEANGRDPITHDSPITDSHHTQPQPQEIDDVYDIELFNGNEGSTPPRKMSPFSAVERYNPERHKSRWDEHKHLGAQDTSLKAFYSRSPCRNDCICTCHSVKNWGRWTLHFPLLGTLMVFYRGVARRTRILCSNPRCQSHQFQEKLVRMDIQPPMWLLRATMSVFLSFGMPSPELVLRVNKVTERTDVHSYMNQLLWSLQRGESAGVKHFLQSGLVRADDFYGDPVIGFTPLRLALDKRFSDIASLLYHSGGFHGTLPASAASSLLLWLEQVPSAADFLTQHFPLSTVIEEADYNTLHQIIIGLRHLDLYEYLRTPEARTMVNQPNAFGRTPLHVAALRGNVDAVLALLDAGAARDARGNHAKHALHYACQAGSMGVVNALLARGASLQVRDSINRTPLFDLVGYGSNTNPSLVTHVLSQGIVQDPADWVNATLLALSNKRTAAVERLLPFWPPAHELPLYPAIHIGYPDGVRLLLGRGADYRTIDAFGEGILHWLAGSGLEMLRLFKGIGVRGVDVSRRDNRGKTAVEIMEGRWDLTEEFRREFMELLDGMEEEGKGEERGGVVGEVDDVAEAADENKAEDQDLSEDEFFDALDSLPAPTTVPEQQSLVSPAGELPPGGPGNAQSLNFGASGSHALSPTAAKQQDLHRDCNETVAHDEESLLYELETAGGYDGESVSSGQRQYMLCGREELEQTKPEEADEGVLDTDSKKYPGSPRIAELEAEKMYTDEAGLKFLGTSATLRSQ